MAYFLKKTTNKKVLYLQIYKSFYDPVSYFREEINRLNQKLAGYNMLVISELSISDKDIYDAYHNL